MALVKHASTHRKACPPSPIFGPATAGGFNVRTEARGARLQSTDAITQERRK